MAVGIEPAAGVTNPSLVEFYNVGGNAWSKGSPLPSPQANLFRGVGPRIDVLSRPS